MASTAATSYVGYQNYVAQTLVGDPTGETPQIPAALTSAALATAIQVDPAVIKAYRDFIGDQLNDQTSGPKFDDISDRIADVVIDTKVQGAGTIEVHLIDPLWVIPRSGFIQTDINGYLWPPIDINYPPGTKCYWRLCQYRPSWGTGTEANLILTFEDRIVSLLREMSRANGGLAQGTANQTLQAFMQMLVDSANQALKLKNPIQMVPLISPSDPNAIPIITAIPSDPENKLKLKTGLTAQMQQLLNNLAANELGAFPEPGSTGSIAETEKALQLIMNQGSAAQQTREFANPTAPSTQYNGQPPATVQGNTGSTQFNGQ